MKNRMIASIAVLLCTVATPAIAQAENAKRLGGHYGG
jgi:hypothetical protein